MTSRRLVQRDRISEGSSPEQRPKQREAAAAREPAELPPYEPPTCALTAKAKRDLDTLRANHDYTRYKRHLDESIKALTNSIGDSNDRLRHRKEALEKAKDRKNKRDQAGNEDELEDNTLEEKQTQCDGMVTIVGGLTRKADIALRELIDYGDELAMKDTIMSEVSDNVAAAPLPRPARRHRRQGSNEDENAENEEAEEEDEADGSIISAVELLKKAQEEYAATYAAKTMRTRYDRNDYKGFKATVHNATFGRNPPPVPHAKKWFPEDNEDEESEDEDVVIQNATLKTKCSLTLQTFKEPYANDKCNHVFEKHAIVGIIEGSGTVYAQPNQLRRGRPAGGVKQLECPESGCKTILQLDDFYIDNTLLRQIKQAERQAARDLEDDEDDEPAPRGTQRGRPMDVDEEGEDSADVKEDRRATIARVKRERQQSRGPSMAPGHQESSALAEDDAEEMDEY